MSILTFTEQLYAPPQKNISRPVHDVMGWKHYRIEKDHWNLRSG